MTTTTTIALIIVAVVAVLLILAVLIGALRNKRTENRRVEAGVIRDKAAERSHEVERREARADEIAARGRAAQAESEAMAAHATGLAHQAQQRRSDVVTARDQLDREYERADKLDPGVATDDTPREQTETRDTPRREDNTGLR